MTPERWAQIEDLFHRAAECGPENRTALLDQVCSDDPELRREVEALLSSDGSAANAMQAALRSEFEDFGLPFAGGVVSHYRIMDGVGGGGMGMVYRAEDIRLGRLVAIKFLPEESANNPVTLARFEREARSASALEHPNICPIYEFGEHEGKPFLVMQLLEGQTLRELLENRRCENSRPGDGAAAQRNMTLRLEQVLDLAIQIADGLHAAHQKGIIHRDIKPANMFITNEGYLKILDFGLAKLAEDVTISGDLALNVEGSGEQARNVDPVLSRTGVAMGTAAYMSPEQVRGEKLDAGTDLFSFGLVLYEMATGRMPFGGESSGEICGAILHNEPPPPAELIPDVSPGLEAVILRALEKDRNLRYQSAAAIRAELQRLKRETESARLDVVASGSRLPRSVDSLAVLPLVNATGDPETEYLSDGISESIINLLSQLPNLRVIARTSAFRYKGREADLKMIGRDLKVRTILTGKMIQRGGRLVVQAELVDVPNDAQIWGGHFNRKLEDIFDVQEELARQISENLQLRLTPEEEKRPARRPTQNREAYQFLLKAQYHLTRQTRESLQRGLAYARQAIEADPGYAEAYGLMSATYSSLSIFRFRTACGGVSQGGTQSLGN